MLNKNLKLIRKELDISAAKLAKRLDVSLGAIQQYEAGTRKPNCDFFEKISTVLNINLNWLIADRGSMFIKERPPGLKEEIKAAVREMLKDEGLTKDDIQKLI